MICTVKSERIVKASQYIIRLYPSSVYHLVAVIPKMRSRYLLTSLYHDTMQKIMEDAIHDVELALLEKGAIAVRKIILKGDPVKKLVEYTVKNPIDLVVISTSRNEMIPRGIIGSTARKIIERIDIPVFVYTALAHSDRLDVNKVLVLPIETLDNRIYLLKEIVKDLVKRFNTGITIHTEFSTEKSRHLADELDKENIEYNIDDRKIEKPLELEELLEEYDLIIIPRCKKGITQRVRSSLYRVGGAVECIDLVVAGLSPKPVILV